MKRQQLPNQTLPQPEACTLLVQAIQTEWSKAARGGALATARGRVPEALRVPLPVAPCDEPYYLVQHVIYVEDDGFEHPCSEIVDTRPADKHTHYVCERAFWHYAPLTVQVKTVPPEAIFGDTIHFDRIHIHWKVNSATITYRADDRAYGAPDTKPGTLIIAGDQWSRIDYNLRYSVEDGWVYEKWVFNVGLFHKPRRNVFLRTEPHAVLSHMSRLR